MWPALDAWGCGGWAAVYDELANSKYNLRSGNGRPATQTHGFILGEMENFAASSVAQKMSSNRKFECVRSKGGETHE